VVERTYSHLYKHIAAVAVLALLVITAVLFLLGVEVVFEPPLLLPVLNTVFISAISFAVAYIAARSYLASGSFSVLMLGCGMLVYGSGGLLAGWLIGPGGPNVNVTIFNIGALSGSVFHFAGAVCSLTGINPEAGLRHRKWKIILAYTGILIFMILIAIASLRGIIPQFFIQWVGPTPLRQAVLGTAIILFTISSLLFMRLYSRLREDFLYWYALGLMLSATGLFTVFFQTAVGSMIGWAGRSANYLGGIYILIAILTTIRKARTRRIPLERAIANFFRESEANFRMLIETVNDAIVSFDNEGRILLWNPAAERIFGYSRGEIVGLSFIDLIIPDRYADSLRKEIETFTITGKSMLVGKTTETEAKRKDGKEFPVEFSTSARKIADGWIYTCIIRDITGRKLIEKELARRAEELARSNAELEQFIYIASHDLQEPLRMISIFTQLLERRYKGRLDKDADEFIAYIVDGAKHMQQMIEDLLAYSRIGTRGKPFEPTDFEAVLEQAVSNLKSAIEENKAQVTHDPLPAVMADASQMVELFQHLISNAIKFRKEEPPRIHVSAKREGYEWVFSVQDNGIGMSPEFMKRLFKIFQREHAAKYPGTGVGLAICRRIVERHGGRIWAESVQGAGTTFYFTIPARGHER